MDLLLETVQPLTLLDRTRVSQNIAGLVIFTGACGGCGVKLWF